MSKTSRWQPDRWHERLAYKRGEDNWYKEVEEEMAEQTMKVYVVVNEWTPEGLDVELTDDVFYSVNEQDAWDVLADLASDRNVPLQMNEKSFVNPRPDLHTQHEIYYIDTIEVNL